MRAASSGGSEPSRDTPGDQGVGRYECVGVTGHADAALGDDQQVVAHVLQLGQHVRGHDHRGAALDGSPPSAGCSSRPGPAGRGPTSARPGAAGRAACRRRARRRPGCAGRRRAFRLLASAGTLPARTIRSAAAASQPGFSSAPIQQRLGHGEPLEQRLVLAEERDLGQYGGSSTGTPKTRRSPVVGCTCRVARPSRVLLPAPFGPTRPQMRPAGIRRSSRAAPSRAGSACPGRGPPGPSCRTSRSGCSVSRHAPHLGSVIRDPSIRHRDSMNQLMESWSREGMAVKPGARGRGRAGERGGQPRRKARTASTRRLVASEMSRSSLVRIEPKCLS